MSSVSRYRVGYWWSEKKSRKIIISELTAVCRASGLELVKLDLDRPFEEQGPFDAIVHKLSDVIVKAKKGDAHSKTVCDSFQEYVTSRPDLAVIDPLPCIERVLDRFQQYRMVQESDIKHRDDIFIPAFVELTSTNVPENLSKMELAGVQFPIVCKPSMAHGSTLSHQMCLIFNAEGLKDVSPPCVVQQFVNHNALLYKLFVIGNEYFVIERPSLKNFSASDQKTIFFDSNEVSKPNSSSELTELDDNEPRPPPSLPQKGRLDAIVRALRRCVGLSLLGIDIVVDNRTGHYAIIDTNVFPGYSEADNFYHLLTKLVLTEIQLKKSGRTSAPFVPTLIDHLSTPLLPEEDAFHFPPITRGQCYCCPITDTCWKNDHQSQCCTIADTCWKNDPIGQLTHQSQCPIAGACWNAKSELIGGPMAQEDSGIETSDSCDEKKNKPCHWTARHSKSSGCPIVKESA